MSATEITCDVLCIGESMVLIAPLEPKPLQLESELRLHVAGAESNVALNLAILGVSTAWASLLGVDYFGDLVLDHIALGGVNVGLVGRRAEPTGVYFKNPTADGTRVIYYRRGSAATCMDAALAGVPISGSFRTTWNCPWESRCSIRRCLRS